MSSDKKINSQTIDSHKIETNRDTINSNRNGLISYMKPKVCEIFKGKHNENSNSNSNTIKTKFFKKEARPKSVNEKKLLKK